MSELIHTCYRVLDPEKSAHDRVTLEVPVGHVSRTGYGSQAGELLRVATASDRG